MPCTVMRVIFCQTQQEMIIVAMGKGIGGMPGGKMGGSGVRGAIAARKAASVAAAAGGPKATRPTAGKPMGMMSNGPAAKTVQPGAGMGIKAKSNTVVDAFRTGGTKAAGKAMGAIAKRAIDSRKKPFGTL